ncbi:hypothetical protein Purlil1_4048 [Purpureocillium lilacinum]|uniref:Uncharacterized protein n=1 Tax=Purpureocillium lilacinum TaxID=33203 RepID=A0ABR0C5G1_PURLI|nr:hypothetical protein Purlil1_4048 [Purpureocillium lilacinum]
MRVVLDWAKHGEALRRVLDHPPPGASMALTIQRVCVYGGAGKGQRPARASERANELPPRQRAPADTDVDVDVMAGRNAALIPCCKPRDRASSIGREARAPLRSQDAQGGPRAANCEPAAGCATAGICKALPRKVRFLGPGMPAILLPAAGRWGGLMSDDACGRTGCSVARPRRWSGLASKGVAAQNAAVAGLVLAPCHYAGLIGATTILCRLFRRGSDFRNASIDRLLAAFRGAWDQGAVPWEYLVSAAERPCHSAESCSGSKISVVGLLIQVHTCLLRLFIGGQRLAAPAVDAPSALAGSHLKPLPRGAPPPPLHRRLGRPPVADLLTAWWGWQPAEQHTAKHAKYGGRPRLDRVEINAQVLWVETSARREAPSWKEVNGRRRDIVT